jgi:hypothetical protein
MWDPLTVLDMKSSVLKWLLDFTNFLLTIPFYIIAKL